MKNFVFPMKFGTSTGALKQGSIWKGIVNLSSFSIFKTAENVVVRIMLLTQKDNVIGNYNPIVILLLVLKSNTVIM